MIAAKLTDFTWVETPTMESFPQFSDDLASRRLAAGPPKQNALFGFNCWRGSFTMNEVNPPWDVHLNLGLRSVSYRQSSVGKRENTQPPEDARDIHPMDDLRSRQTCPQVEMEQLIGLAERKQVHERWQIWWSPTWAEPAEGPEWLLHHKQVIPARAHWVFIVMVLFHTASWWCFLFQSSSGLFVVPPVMDLRGKRNIWTRWWASLHHTRLMTCSLAKCRKVVL